MHACAPSVREVTETPGICHLGRGRYILSPTAMQKTRVSKALEGDLGAERPRENNQCLLNMAMSSF